ncbi:MAG: TlpA family protein disulfide reductase [Phycisphaerae bacterium]|nr:TlpA family protein disulfide reductase [Phycisphaerae bacterium]
MMFTCLKSRQVAVAMCLMLGSLSSQVFADPAAPRSIYEILAKAQDAASDLRSLAYEAELFGEGRLAGAMTGYAGSVRLRFGETPGRLHIRIDGERRTSKLKEPAGFTFADDSQNACLLDRNARTFAKGISSEGRVPERESILPINYLGNSAYESELQAAALIYGGVVESDGEPCDVVEVHYDEAGRRRSRLFISQSDRILRRIERPILVDAAKSDDQAFNATVVLAIRNVVRNPRVDDSLFQLDKPEEFRNTRFQMPRFAPRPPSGGSGSRSTEPEQPAARPAQTPTSDAGAVKSSGWTLRSASGEDVTLGSLRGKVVVLDFWATWCFPCRMAMPSVQEIHEKYRGRPVAVFGVNCMERGNGADPLAVIKEKHCTYGQLLDGNSVANLYGVRALPTFVVIGKDGRVIMNKAGFDAAAIQSAIETGLRE